MESIINNLLEKYDELNLHTIIDYDKFNHYSITHHSTKIEGSTLTETETRLLLDEGLTPNNRPISHSLMVLDHLQALHFIIEYAASNKPITLSFIQQINSLVMKQTGSLLRTPLGDVDLSKGEFRKGNVSAGGHYFPNYDKVIPYTESFIENLNKNLLLSNSKYKQLLLSFNAHLDLITIHPFYDGNGRTSRLLMNFIQAKNNLPLCIVFSEDKTEYINVLQKAQKENFAEPFIDFMLSQYSKYLKKEIESYHQMEQLKPGTKKGLSFFF